MSLPSPDLLDRGDVLGALRPGREALVKKQRPLELSVADALDVVWFVPEVGLGGVDELLASE